MRVAGYESATQNFTFVDRSVSIEKCRQSTIVLGPVETTIHVNSCEQLTVIAPCRRITIRYARIILNLSSVEAGALEVK